MTLDELMSQLLNAVEVFRGQQVQEVQEEEEREQREAMKRDQDMAYQESLIADRAKVIEGAGGRLEGRGGRGQVV